MANKFYWLKLKRDFFKRHDIRIVESMPNGKDYILFYLKLLCESVDHEGNLRFSAEIPYNETMLATITNTNVDIVRSAIEVFSGLQMMEKLDDGTYFMNEVKRMLGSAVDTDGANRVRRFREKQKQELLPAVTGALQNVTQGVTERNESKSIELDIEIEKEKKKENIHTLFSRLCQDFSFPDFVIDKLKEWIAYKIERRESYKEQGMKSLLRQIDNNIMQYGPQAVCDLIDDSMANGWKGIIFDRLKQNTPQKRNYTQPKSSNPFLDMVGDCYD